MQKAQNTCKLQMPLVRLLHKGRQLWHTLRLPPKFHAQIKDGRMDPAPITFCFGEHQRNPTHTASLLHLANETFIRRWNPRPMGTRIAERAEPTMNRAGAFHDWRYLRDALRGTDCNQVFDAVNFKVDVVQKYKAEPDDVESPLNNVEQTWRKATIDAIAVHIKSATEVNIVLPLVPSFLWPDWSVFRHVQNQDADPNFLAQALSKRAAEIFLSSRRAEQLKETNKSTQFVEKVGRHKKELLQLGDDVALIKQANSDRPFFALMKVSDPIVGDEPVELELWHLYCAMGLPEQHPWQQTLLARCYDWIGAISLLCAIQELLGKRVYSTMVAEPTSQSSHTTSLRENFLAALERACGYQEDIYMSPTTLSDLSGDSVVQSTREAQCLLECTAFLSNVLPPHLIDAIAQLQ